MIDDLIFQQIAFRLLGESALDRSAIGKYRWRLDKFIDFVKRGKHFKVAGQSGQSPKKDAVLSLRIFDKSSNETIPAGQDSTLQSPEELSAFKAWISKGSSSGFIVKPVWDGAVKSWSQLYKDPENFRSDTPEKGVIGEQSLTPRSLGLLGKPISSRNLLNLAGSAIDSKFDVHIADILKDLLAAALSASGEKNISIDPQLSERLATLDTGDKRRIVKDFGEVLSAAMLVDEDNSIIVFSPPSNPLIDFSLRNPKTNTRKDYSAKGLSGSGSSMRNYREGLSYLAKESSGVEQKIAEILSDADSLTRHGLVMKLAVENNPLLFLNPEAEGSSVYERLGILKGTLGLEGDPNDEDVYNAAVKQGWIESVRKYYLSLGLADPVDTLSLRDLSENKELIKSLFTYPILKACIDEMNAESSYFKRVVANAVRNSSDFAQVTINFDNLENPTTLSLSEHFSPQTESDNIVFSTKASRTSFKSGGINVTIK